MTETLTGLESSVETALKDGAYAEITHPDQYGPTLQLIVKGKEPNTVMGVRFSRGKTEDGATQLLDIRVAQVNPLNPQQSIWDSGISLVRFEPRNLAEGTQLTPIIIADANNVSPQEKTQGIPSSVAPREQVAPILPILETQSQAISTALDSLDSPSFKPPTPDELTTLLTEQINRLPSSADIN